MKIDRLVSIIMLLLEKERVGAKELADLFEVSQRTIYRDIDTINMAGIPVYGTSGVGGGFAIMPNYKVDKNIFSTADLSALLMGLSSLSTTMRGDELVNALAKVKSFIPAEQTKAIELKTNQICIDLNPWMGNPNTKLYLDLIKTAIQENKLLQFHYADSHGNETSRTVEPYQLILKSNHWYFQGYCQSRQDYRLFKLSRMSSLQISEETFSPRDYEKPLLDYEQVRRETPCEITLRIHRSIMDRALDYCSYEQLVPDGEEHYTVHFPFFENDYYYNMILSLGDKCECIKPAHIRKEIIRRIQSLAKIYSD